jgi:hypothetical protein
METRDFVRLITETASAPRTPPIWNWVNTGQPLRTFTALVQVDAEQQVRDYGDGSPAPLLDLQLRREAGTSWNTLRNAIQRTSRYRPDEVVHTATPLTTEQILSTMGSGATPVVALDIDDVFDDVDDTFEEDEEDDF